MSDYNINNMDFKQLRNEVQLLRDELAIMKRKYEDIIYNLDTDNFSSRLVKQGENMYTKIEQNAESISLQAEKVSENSQNIASLEITADEIQSEVYEEQEDGTKISRITQNAESITSEVESRKSADTQLSTRITQTSSEIRSVVSKNISVKFESSVKPTYSNTTDEEKGMLCEYGGTLYYYNDITETWKVYPYADGIKSQFIQTASGFEFTSDVKIDADLIVSGTISADRIDTDNLSCTRLYASGYTYGYYAKIASSVGDFGIYTPSASTYSNPLDDECIFGVYHSDVVNKVVNFYAYGENYMGYNGKQNTTWAKGNWDFSVANVDGLEDSGYATKSWVLTQIGSSTV